jgi:hypothetical protein
MSDGGKLREASWVLCESCEPYREVAGGFPHHSAESLSGHTNDAE